MRTNVSTKNFIGLSLEPTGDLETYYNQNPASFSRKFLNVHNAGGITVLSNSKFAFVAGRADQVIKVDGGGFNGVGLVANTRSGYLDQLKIRSTKPAMSAS